jgi:flagella basal body P-ring formation protein FlgA
MKSIKVKSLGQSYWVNALFLESSTAFVLNQDFYSFNAAIPKSFLTKRKSLVKESSNLFTDYKNLEFYKVNKRLKKGHLLKRTDLIPRKIVKFGSTVQVILKGENISLKGKAYARQSGHIGETIELLNPKSKKKIQGTVSNFNEVTIKI